MLSQITAHLELLIKMLRQPYVMTNGQGTVAVKGRVHIKKKPEANAGVNKNIDARDITTK